MGKKHDFLSDLASNKVLVSDGAWGTLMMQQGLKAGDCPEKWNRDFPERVEVVARAYVEAGADIIETNSFGGSRIKLEHYGLDGQAEDLNAWAAEISKKAGGDKAFVMGSVGPTGKMLITGEVSESQVFDAFAEQGRGLEKGGADLLIIETMSDLQEASLAISACLENTKLPLVCSMSFETAGEDKYATMMGVTPAQFVEEQINSGITILGSNCGKGTSEMLGVAKQLRKETMDFPLLIQANAGIPAYEEGEMKFPDEPGDWKEYIQNLFDMNINIIGGCCGTSPAFIHNIRTWVDEYLS
jgi:5-methyltetrahydrofolate--homocysteine methyltransferase